MPTYQYVCDACGKEFEAQQRMSDAPLTECQCGEKGQVRRLIGSGAGIIFKGKGFYETDYKRNGASKSESKAESAPAAAPACGSGGCCPCE
jgi:putative FmdB family regulatory protein